MNKLLLPLILLISLDVMACRPVSFDANAEFLEADDVAVFSVTGILAVEAESVLMGNEPDDENFIMIPVQRSVRVVNTENLKGKLEKLMTVKVGCSFLSELLWSVVIFKKGNNVWLRNIPLEIINKWRENAIN